MKKIQRALISTYRKNGLVELGKALSRHNIEIYSTGGTLRTLLDAGIQAKSIESYTNFPEMLDGRVKTLHPKIHGGILARRDSSSHMENLATHDILTFDLVCINLYPFEEIVRKEDFSFEDAIENIDIGGPSMIRAAAKNYNDVTVIVDPAQYDELVRRLDENKGEVSQEYRFEMAVQAFTRTAAYDTVISQYLNNLQGYYFPDTMNISLTKTQALRYGENPHQEAAFYAPILNDKMPWQQLHGKELSYNNLLDMDAALRLARDFHQPICAIFKHTNPCGVAMGNNQLENLKKAIETDPVSFFGGIVTFNEVLQPETAKLLSEHFFEIIVALDFSPEALEILQAKKNIRLIRSPGLMQLQTTQFEIRNASFGFLVQQADRKIVTEKDIEVVSIKKPDAQDIHELLFAFQIVKYIKSNAIVFTANGQSRGIGAGQMSRVDSMRFAIEKAETAGLSLKDSYLASDAFFPFRDGIDLAIKAGVKAVIQPGGSMRDQESIDAANEAGIIMVHTGVRHFRH